MHCSLGLQVGKPTQSCTLRILYICLACLSSPIRSLQRSFRSASPPVRPWTSGHPRPSAWTWPRRPPPEAPEASGERTRRTNHLIALFGWGRGWGGQLEGGGSCLPHFLPPKARDGSQSTVNSTRLLWRRRKGLKPWVKQQHGDGDVPPNGPMDIMKPDLNTGFAGCCPSRLLTILPISGFLFTAVFNSGGAGGRGRFPFGKDGTARQ